MTPPQNTPDGGGMDTPPEYDCPECGGDWEKLGYGKHFYWECVNKCVLVRP